MTAIIAIVLVLVTAISYCIGFTIVAAPTISTTAMEQIYSAILFTCGTISLGALGIMNMLGHLTEIRDRLPKPAEESDKPSLEESIENKLFP